MRKLFWPNFEFEHELVAGKHWRPNEKFKQLDARFATVLRVLCGEDDRIVLPVIPEGTKQVEPFLDEQIALSSNEYHGNDWQLIPWGPTDRLQKLADERGWIWNQPPISVVKTLNDRLTAFEWESSKGQVPAGMQIINDESSLQSALETISSAECLIKTRFGMSGRERICVSGTALSESQQGWLRKKFAEQGSVILEPWLEIESEAGLQFEIPQQGEPQFLAVLPLVNAPSGEYRGSRLKISEEQRELWQPAIDEGLEFSRLAQGKGYFGPLGIDVCFYRDGEKLRLRFTMDINARWTMGRIACEWGIKFPNLSEWTISDYIA